MKRSNSHVLVTLSWLVVLVAGVVLAGACSSELTAPSETPLTDSPFPPTSESSALLVTNGALGAVRSHQGYVSSAGVFRGFACQVTPDGLPADDSIAVISSSGGETLYCSGQMDQAPGSSSVQRNVTCTLYSSRLATRSVLTISSSGRAVLSCSR